MNSSPSCATLPLKQPDTAGMRVLTRRFEKYGMHFSYSVLESSEPEWTRAVVSEAEDRVDWTHTGKNIKQYQILNAWVRLSKNDMMLPIWVYTTPDGPILGVEGFSNTQIVRNLMYPCVVTYRHGSLDFLPIFNSASYLALQNHAVRTIQTPSEVLLAAYPGFVIQAKMGKFDLPLAKPIHDTEEETPVPYTATFYPSSTPTEFPATARRYT